MIGTDDPYYLYVYATTIWTYFLYWFTSTLYGILDFTQRPKFLHKYKTQPGTNETPNLRELLKVWQTLEVNVHISLSPTIEMHILMLSLTVQMSLLSWCWWYTSTNS